MDGVERALEIGGVTRSHWIKVSEGIWDFGISVAFEWNFAIDLYGVDRRTG